MASGCISPPASPLLIPSPLSHRDVRHLDTLAGVRIGKGSTANIVRPLARPGQTILDWEARMSPFVSMGKVTVCWTCRRATLSEGYRPAS